MVTFTRIPYAQAARRAHMQDWVVYTSLAAISAILILLTFWFVAR